MYDSYANMRRQITYNDLRNRLISKIGGFICSSCRYDNSKALMVVYKEYNGSKNNGKLTTKKLRYYIDNQDKAINDLVILCYNCERKKRNRQRPSFNKIWQKYGRTNRHKRRIQIFDILNQYKCKDCGIDDFELLQIDHKNGGGNRALTNKFNNKYNEHIYYINNPDQCKQDLQIMCVNCNILKQRDNHEWFISS